MAAAQAEVVLAVVAVVPKVAEAKEAAQEAAQVAALALEFANLAPDDLAMKLAKLPAESV